VRHISVQQLSAYVDGALTGVSRELVTRHLAACTQCQNRHASWRARGETLRQALSWQPAPHTLEEWSSRVELVLTAERKGLPAPEFTTALHPVIAPVTPPAPADMKALFQQQASTKPAPPRPAYVAPPPPPAPAPPPRPATPAGPLEPAPFLTSPPTVPPIPPARAPEPVWMEATGVPVSPPPPRLGTYDLHGGPNMRTPPPYVAAWTPPPRSSNSVLRAALVIGGLLAAVFVASPYLPEVIRIPVPEQWLPKLPRLEFVRKAAGPEPAKPAPDPSLQLATSAPLVAQVVPPEPVVPPVDSAAIREASLRDSLAQLAAEIARAKAAKAKPAPRPRARPVEELEPDGWTEPDGPLAPERNTTLVPVSVKTSVSLVPSSPRPAPAPPPEPESDASWPLLCGEVITFAGVPVEGARVELVSPPLTVRTDRRGRFCVACPPGARVLRVEHAAFEPVNRAVELTAGGVETRIWLTTPR
jgi:hypothetical protein